MADLIAELLTGPADWGGGAPWVRETDSGTVGHQDWFVQTAFIEKARVAARAPRVGDSWSTGGGDFPNLAVTSVEWRYVGGALNVADQTGGVCWGSVDFATPSLNGRLPVPEYGQAYAVVKPSIGTVQRYADIRREFPDKFESGDFDPITLPGIGAFPTDRQIAGGRGTAAAVGTTAIEVTTWRRARDVDLKRLVRLQRYQMVNSDRVTTPVILNDTHKWTFEPGELQFKTFDIGSDRGFTRLTMTMEMSEDFILRQVEEDQFGNATDAEPDLFALYPPGKFLGLW